MISGFVIIKAVAIYIGPNGSALVGQFTNFSQIIMTVAQEAINTGVTKYAAEYGKESERIPALFSTASKINLVSSVIVGAGIMVFSSFASEYLLKSEGYTYVFVIFGFTIVLFAINSLLLLILNGFKEIKTFVMINIVQSIYGLIFTTLLIVFLDIDGALIALVANQSAIFLIVLWMLRKHQAINLENFKGAFDDFLDYNLDFLVTGDYLVTRKKMSISINELKKNIYMRLFFFNILARSEAR